MEASVVIAAINLALQNAPAMIAAGKDVASLVMNVINTFKGKSTVTKEELDAMVARSKALEDEIMAPLPEGD